MQQHTDELLDIVNEHDEVIGQEWRLQTNQEQYKRCVLAFLVNAENKLCILRRSAHKKAWPNHLALVGGCVSSGEEYNVALVREVQEEINLDISFMERRLLGILKPWETDSSYFKAMYEIKVESSEVAFNNDDFSEYFWLAPHELFQEPWINDILAPDLLLVVQRFYGHLITT